MTINSPSNFGALDAAIVGLYLVATTLAGVLAKHLTDGDACQSARQNAEHIAPQGRAPDQAVSAMQLSASPGWKTSKQGRMTFKDTKGGPRGDPASKDMLVIKPNPTKRRFDVVATITEAEVGPFAAGELSAQLGIGGLGWQVTQPWTLNKKGTVLKAD